MYLEKHSLLFIFSRQILWTVFLGVIESAQWNLCYFPLQEEQVGMNGNLFPSVFTECPNKRVLIQIYMELFKNCEKNFGFRLYTHLLKFTSYLKNNLNKFLVLWSLHICFYRYACCIWPSVNNAKSTSLFQEKKAILVIQIIVSLEITVLPSRISP